MATIARVKARWTIPGAGTAYSVFHFGNTALEDPVQADADAALAKVTAFFTSVKAYLPNVVSVLVQNEVELIQWNNGSMTGILSGPTQATQTGTAGATAGWAAAAGAVVTWNTAGIRNNRRVRGRTFLVPLSNEAWDVDGTLKAVPVSGINAAATTLRDTAGSIDLMVYGRPTAPGATDGEAFAVSGHRLPDMSAVLTSRRS